MGELRPFVNFQLDAQQPWRVVRSGSAEPAHPGQQLGRPGALHAMELPETSRRAGLVVLSSFQRGSDPCAARPDGMRLPFRS